jgi:uncharacterized protein YciI
MPGAPWKSACEEGSTVYFALFYETVDDYVARRQAFRAAHLAHAEAAHRAGLLVLGGALQPPDAALLVFRAESAQAVEDFARADPYVKNGVVKSWRVREWTVVVGA